MMFCTPCLFTPMKKVLHIQMTDCHSVFKGRSQHLTMLQHKIGLPSLLDQFVPVITRPPCFSQPFCCPGDNKSKQQLTFGKLKHACVRLGVCLCVCVYTCAKTIG